MISSFFKNSYGDLLKSIVISQKPKLVIEYGILFGYSTINILEAMKFNGFGKLISNDMFDEFPFNHAEEKITLKMFDKIENVEIRKSNFYNIGLKYETKSLEDIKKCDILIIDIGNMRKTFEFFVNNIYPVLKTGSMAILEGGSVERDDCYKLKGYSDESINDYLKTLLGFRFITFNSFPSITIFTK